MLDTHPAQVIILCISCAPRVPLSSPELLLNYIPSETETETFGLNVVELARLGICGRRGRAALNREVGFAPVAKARRSFASEVRDIVVDVALGFDGG